MTGPGSRIRVLIVDDHEAIRSGFTMMISAQPDMVVVGEASDGTEGRAYAARLRPDVVLADIRMPGMDGLELTRRLNDDDSFHGRIVVVTTYDRDEYVYRALRAGAAGFLLKRSGPTLVIEAIRAAIRGDVLISPQLTLRLFAELADSAPRGDAADLPDLTERERDVLRRIAGAMSNAEIGDDLFISEHTVKTHVTRLMAKFGVRSRVALAARAWEHDIPPVRGG